MNICFLKYHANKDVEQFFISEQVDTSLDHTLRVSLDFHIPHFKQKGSNKLVIAGKILPLDKFNSFAQLRKFRYQKV